MKNKFAQCLSSLLDSRGAARALSESSKVPTSHISKMCAGTVLPSPDTLAALIEPLGAQDRAALVVEYLKLHLPGNAPMVQIRVTGEEEPGQDRLERAIAFLEPLTRDRLGALVEAVNRCPVLGARALQAVGELFDTEAQSAPETPAVEPPLSVYAQAVREFETRQAARYGGPDELPGRRVAEEPPGFPAREGAGPVLRVVEPVEDAAAAKELKERKKGRGGA